MESCANIRAMTRDIYAPEQGESIQIGQHTNSFSISLSDELLANLRMSQVSPCCVATLRTKCSFHASSRTMRLATLQVASLALQALPSRSLSLRLSRLSRLTRLHEKPSKAACSVRGQE